MATEQYDIVIIGSGAGGGTLAHHLAPSGKKILIVERGDFLPRERENWDEHEVFTEGRYRSKEAWLDKDGEPFEPFTHYWVGGNTKMYGAALLRLRAEDFEERRHYDGTSPAWPIGYDELEPYYTRAEHLYSVHGEHGVDPTDPPRSAPYRYPPLRHEPRIAKLYEDLRELGLHPFPLPVAVRLGEDQGVPHAPINLSYFDGYPDLTEAKADADVVAVRPALAFRNVSILTRAYAHRLETSANGREIVAAMIQRDGEEVRVEGDIFVVACGAINSAALFLRSQTDRHPDGLANGSGLVGRHYMAHNNGSVIAISETPNDAQFQKTFGLTDFYHGAPDSELPLGAVQLMGKTDLEGLKGLLSETMPDADPEEISRHSIDFWLTTEDLPRPDNRVTLTSDGTIRVSYTPNNIEPYQRLKQKLIAVLEQCGCQALHRDSVYLDYKASVSGVSHQNGTLRFGTDPKSSVLDLHCKAHELNNLYVCDASFFPSCGAVNPSLTTMANAMRVGDHLLERLR